MKKKNKNADIEIQNLIPSDDFDRQIIPQQSKNFSPTLAIKSKGTAKTGIRNLDQQVLVPVM